MLIEDDVTHQFVVPFISCAQLAITLPQEERLGAADEAAGSL